MLKALLDLNVASVRRRIAQGDCPTEPALSVETLEHMIQDLADNDHTAGAPLDKKTFQDRKSRYDVTAKPKSVDEMTINDVALLADVLQAFACGGPLTRSDALRGVGALDMMLLLQDRVAPAAQAESYANAPVSLDAKRADKARDSKLYSARDAMVEELRDIDAGVVEVDAMVLFTRIPDGNGLWTSGWRFAGLNTTEAVGFTALCLHMLMNEARTGG